ncbi:putative enzyme with nucleoside triphosphate hydrolase domain [Desulfamplus magnetovallimortis]|uniref:PhoH-like protein n=1 Tax=Desulfamplus magnetovallimortis TaxID=1246637 RepID=A0A1W1H9A8_9BACT|nr:PhoH family protein [Desulfamplus magnetovallimortis]SLM29024.1 putative enzyme with nucleoside triphosphate hydrolase domain [Desulfamplus magnetovallimortis]
MKEITFDNAGAARDLFGHHNDNLARISEATGVRIDSRGTTLVIKGSQESVNLTEKILNQLYELVKEKFTIHPADIESAALALKKDHSCSLRDIFLDTIFTTFRKKNISPRNPAQKKYVDAARRHDIVFAIGPAGTGKTYLAMALAVAALGKGEINRIILTRPAVEAGEALGFLPGDLSDKINPYLRPLYDALHDMLSFDRARELIEHGTIEIAPLAFMRGRTLNNAFIILDEAQNTTSEQMKMFLTRIGFSSRAVITGDVTQTDLPAGKRSGLVEAEHILQNIEGLKFSYFTKNDVVRHKLVSKIIDAYDKNCKKTHK